MSYQEQKSLVSLISSILIFVVYSWVLIERVAQSKLEEVEMLRFWGMAIIILILISIVVKVVITVLFTIGYRIATKTNEPSFSDELDQLIDLKSLKGSYFIFMVGFGLAMCSVAIYESVSLMFIILLVTGFISEAAGEVRKIYLYRKGV